MSAPSRSPSRTLPKKRPGNRISHGQGRFWALLKGRIAVEKLWCDAQGAILLARRCGRPRSLRTILGATGDGRGRGVRGVVERRFGDHTGPRIEDERCAIGRRLVGGKERIKRVPCHALDRDLQIDHRCLGLLIKSDHGTASGIGEGAHAAAASVAGNCQCHAGVRKAALPDVRRCGAACSGHLKAVTGQSGRARAELGSSIRRLGLPTTHCLAPDTRQ